MLTGSLSSLVANKATGCIPVSRLERMLAEVWSNGWPSMLYICNFSSDIIRVLDGVCCRGTMCRSLFQDQEPRTDTYFDFTDQYTRKIEGFLNGLGNFATEELPIPRSIQGHLLAKKMTSQTSGVLVTGSC